MTFLRFNEMSYSLRSIKANRDHAFFCSRQEFSLSHTHTHPFNRLFFRDYLGEPVRER